MATEEAVGQSNESGTRIQYSDPELVFESGFEDANVARGEYTLLDSASGFFATRKTFEVQFDHPSVGPASEGNRHAELDGLNGIYRDVETNENDKFTLTLDYSARPFVNAAGNRIEVFWGDERVGVMEQDGTDLRTTDFQQFEFEWQANSSGSQRLEFRSVDPIDSIGLGGLLDNIVLERSEATVINDEPNKFEVIVEVTDEFGRRDTETFYHLRS